MRTSGGIPAFTGLGKLQLSSNHHNYHLFVAGPIERKFLAETLEQSDWFTSTGTFPQPFAVCYIDFSRPAAEDIWSYRIAYQADALSFSAHRFKAGILFLAFPSANGTARGLNAIQLILLTGTRVRQKFETALVL